MYNFDFFVPKSTPTMLGWFNDLNEWIGTMLTYVW